MYMSSNARATCAVALSAVALLLSGCGLFNISRDEPLCDPPQRITNCRVPGDSEGLPPGPITPSATAQRFPVVALPDNRDAQIMASAREASDRANPVHKFLYGFDVASQVIGSGSDLAGSTAQTFIASGRSDLSGKNNSLTADASGASTAVWAASNAGVVELYANSRELIARPGALLTHRVAMNGRGGSIVAWQEGDGTIRSRDRIGESAFTPAFTHPSPQLSTALGDVVFIGGPAVIVWSTTGGAVSASVGLGANWDQAH